MILLIRLAGVGISGRVQGGLWLGLLLLELRLVLLLRLILSIRGNWFGVGKGDGRRLMLRTQRVAVVVRLLHVRVDLQVIIMITRG